MRDDRDQLVGPRTQEEVEIAAQAIELLLIRAADAARDLPARIADRLAEINRTLDGEALDDARRELWLSAIADLKGVMRDPLFRGRLQ